MRRTEWRMLSGGGGGGGESTGAAVAVLHAGFPVAGGQGQAGEGPAGGLRDAVARRSAPQGAVPPDPPAGCARGSRPGR
eukprot:439723-Prorocentrum_minimum.AAC.1